MGSVIRHSLDLVIRLIDTTTGRALAGGQIELFRDGGRLHFERREENLLLIDSGREDFDLLVKVAGFEERSTRVAYGALDEKLPALELHLIPGGRAGSGGAVLTLAGEYPGIGSIDAVRAGDAPALLREFDERRRLMKLFNPHHLEMNSVFYGIVDPDGGSFEAIEIEKRLSESEYKLTRKLAKEFKNNAPVTRMVFGSVSEAGHYLLRVRDDSREAKWLVRCTADGKEAFYPIDFKQPETLALRPRVT
jgi:hypothetical protein